MCWSDYKGWKHIESAFYMKTFVYMEVSEYGGHGCESICGSVCRQNGYDLSLGTSLGSTSRLETKKLELLCMMAPAPTPVFARPESLPGLSQLTNWQWVPSRLDIKRLELKQKAKSVVSLTLGRGLSIERARAGSSRAQAYPGYPGQQARDAQISIIMVLSTGRWDRLVDGAA